MNPHKITEQFEEVLTKYTGAKHAIATDSCSNAILISLMYLKMIGEIKENDFITIPSHTYPSVPNSIILNGLKVHFEKSNPILRGEYQLYPTIVWDSALTFRSGMYKEGQLQCLSFTGSRKILKLTSGGAILTDSDDAYLTLQRLRYSGRRPVDYLQDTFDMLGYRCWMNYETAARGLGMMVNFPKENEDVAIQYPDLSIQPAFKPYTI